MKISARARASDWKSEVGSRKSEVRSQKSEVRSRKFTAINSPLEKPVPRFL
ncbi:MAG: hypothetical protein PHW92_02080 [Lutibacter sp.]|nr:hypothetical protein [Lutibacter sp.]